MISREIFGTLFASTYPSNVSVITQLLLTYNDLRFVRLANTSSGRNVIAFEDKYLSNIQ